MFLGSSKFGEKGVKNLEDIILKWKIIWETTLHFLVQEYFNSKNKNLKRFFVNFFKNTPTETWSNKSLKVSPIHAS